MLNNVKPYFFLNEMNKKDFTCNVFHCILVFDCRLLFFGALLRNHCYSFHRTKWRLVTSICRGPGPVATRMPFFRWNSNPLQTFQLQPKRETSSSSLGDQLEKRSIISPIKSSHLCRTSRHVWLSSSACDHCSAYQLICIMTISTYTTGASAGGNDTSTRLLHCEKASACTRHVLKC